MHPAELVSGIPVTQPLRALTCPGCGHPFDLSTKGHTWTIRQPQDVADRLMARYGRLEQEHLVVLSLDTKNHVRSEVVAYVGSIAAAHVRIGELLCEPIRQRAAGLIVVHNHPSGDPAPSPDDLHLTAEALAAAKLLDLALLDHIIVSADRWVSLRDRGINFDRPS
jgi:DNA repair protein RadC